VEDIMHADTVSLDHQVVKGILLIGLLLGMLGALFLAYHLLGSHDGPLRKIVRLAIPGFLGGLAIIPLYLLIYLVAGAATRAFAPGTSPESPDLFQLLVTLPMTGTFLGVMTALYETPVDDPAARPIFSRRDALGGFLLALGYIVITEVFKFARHPYDGMAARDYWIVGSVSFLTTALVTGVSAGLWRGASRHRASDTKPGRFAPRAAVVGAGAAVAMSLVPNLVGGAGATLLLPELRTLGMIALNLAVVPLTSALVMAPTGAIIGGLWPRVFWWVNHAREKRLEFIGILCMLIGFVAQAVEPIVALLAS
jgi:hypothetical protein